MAGWKNPIPGVRNVDSSTLRRIFESIEKWTGLIDSGSLTTTPSTGSVTTTTIADGSVTTAKIADGAVGDAKISSSANINPSKLDQNKLGSFVERYGVEPLQRWNREFGAVRYGLNETTKPDFTDVVVVGDSISEGWFGSGSNGTAWPQRFQRLLAQAANTDGRFGAWIPGGTGNIDSTWYTTPRFSPATTTTAAASQAAGRQDLTVSSVAELNVGSKFIVDSNTTTVYTVVSIDVPTAYLVVDALLPALTAGSSRICVTGTESISRGLGLRSMALPKGAKVSTTVTATSVDLFFRYKYQFAQAGIRFSVTDQSSTAVYFPLSSLGASMNSSTTSVTLSATAASVGIIVGSVLRVDSELLTVTAISGSTLTVTRGASPAAHSSGAGVFSTTASFLTYKTTGAYCATLNGEEVSKLSMTFPSRGTYTVLVEQLTMQGAAIASTTGAFNGSALFDGMYVHDGTETQGVRVWNAARFGSTYNSWNNIERYQVATLASAATTSSTSLTLSTTAAAAGIKAGSWISVLNDTGFLVYEQMLVTSVSGSTVNVVRAQGDTTADTHAVGRQVMLSWVDSAQPTLNTGWVSQIRQGLMDPSLYVIALGSNDQGVSASGMDSRMRLMVSTINAAHIAGGLGKPSIVFMVPPFAKSTTTVGAWDLVLDQMYATAGALGAAVWDWAEFTGAVIPLEVNTLAASMTSTATTLTLTSTAPDITVGSVISILPSAGQLQVFEKLFVTAVSGTTLTVVRGFAGSTATTHDSGASVRVGDPYYWTADGIHPNGVAHEAIGDWAASRAMVGSSDLFTTPFLVRATDSRLSDSRTPTAHVSTHAVGGSDPLPAATTSAVGLVQLTDSTSSTSTSTAATANSVKVGIDRVRESMNFTSTSIDVIPRTSTLGGVAATSGVVYFSFFTPSASMTISQISYAVAATVSSGLTLCRFGLYTFTDGATPRVDLVARTASDTTIFNTANTVYTKPLATAGGYPATYDLVAGNRYAIAVIAVGTTAGNIVGVSSPTQILSLAPRLNATLQSQTDLPTSTTSFGAPTVLYWGRVS